MSIRGGGVVLGALSAAVFAALPRAAAAQSGEVRDPEAYESVRNTEPPTQPGEHVGEAPAAQERRLLMNLLDRAGLAQPLDDARIRVFGYVEAGYTYNPDPTEGGPAFGDINLDRIFDFESSDPVLNQINLTFERQVATSPNEWDVGFRTEVIYGADSRFLHSNGLNFYGPGVPFGPSAYFQQYPENQFDLFQAYVDVGVPVGKGLGLRVGKFASFFGGTVDPNGNTFYSRSLIFASSHPLTFTGVLARYDVTDRVTVEGGFSRGWDQALKDNNAALDALARVTFLVDDRTGLALAAVTGPENDGDSGNWRTLFEATLKRQVTDRLRLIATGTYGQESHFHDEGDPTDPTDDIDLRDARWYAVAGYANYLLDQHFSLNGRLEFLRDEKGFATGLAGNTYSATLGVTVTPFTDSHVGKNFKIRPEVRLDYSEDDRYGGSIVDGFDSNSQFTFGIDAIYNF
jgi:hypothetical protein